MRLSIRKFLAAGVSGLAAMAAVVATAAPAHAINRVDCGDRSDFLRIDNGGRLCFANAGEMNVAIYGVNYVSTGNNVVRIRYQVYESNPGYIKEVGIGKWGGWQPNWHGDVTPYVHKITWIKIH